MNWRVVFIVSVLSLISVQSAVAEIAKVIELTEDNWRSILKNEWMIEFYAPWCPACKNLAPAWERLADWSNDLNIKTGQIDVTTSPALSGRFLVTALPTIFHVINGEFRQYRGSRSADHLMAFIEDQKWRDLEPLTPWKNPDSIQMTVVSYFFKLSHYLKEINTVMLVDYGLPPWVTYVLFAVVTILLGALLGLLLVSIIDLIFPPVSASRKSFKQAQTDEDAKDEIEDDGDAVAGRNAVQPLKDEEDDDEDDNTPSTSEGEKFSGSDSESDENKIIKSTKDKKSPKSSPEVRKRKPRKAD